jgi:hypothetical protein
LGILRVIDLFKGIGFICALRPINVPGLKEASFQPPPDILGEVPLEDCPDTATSDGIT